MTSNLLTALTGPANRSWEALFARLCASPEVELTYLLTSLRDDLHLMAIDVSQGVSTPWRRHEVRKNLTEVASILYPQRQELDDVDFNGSIR